MEQLLTFSPAEIGLALASTVLFVMTLLYILVVMMRPCRHIARMKPADTTDSGQQPPVSVIIYACGQEEALGYNIDAYLSQDYPEFQVIVAINETDVASNELLSTIEQREKRLYHTVIPNDTRYLSRKKLALTLAVKAAKHEVLLFSEANSIPVSNRWIAEMCGGYGKSTDLVIGFNRFHVGKGFRNHLMAYDNLVDGIRQLSSALARKTYAGNGKNLSYKKSLFFKHKGYYQSLNLHAGADDLFVNEVATPLYTEVVLTPDSMTEVQRPDAVTFREFKVDRIATEHYYRGHQLTFHRFFTFIGIFLFPLVALLTIVLGLFGNWLISIWAFLLLALRFFIKMSVVHRTAKLLGQKNRRRWFIIMDWFLPLYDLYIRLYHLHRRKNDYTFVLDARRGN